MGEYDLTHKIIHHHWGSNSRPLGDKPATNQLTDLDKEFNPSAKSMNGLFKSNCLLHW